MNKIQEANGPFQKLVGYEYIGENENGLVLRLDVEEKHMGSRGRLHGGLVATLLDAVGGSTFYRKVGDVERVVTVNLSINYLGSVREGCLIAESEIRYSGKSIGYASMTLREGSREGPVLATAQGVFRLYRRTDAA
ncbi:MAG: PaaI family thioesterase [Pseudomonadota bacterium]